MQGCIRRIGTHDGVFHCDEVFACYLLKKLPDFSNAEIVRTRQPRLLEECDVVVDVGGEYDPAKHRYDHHQRTFSSTMNTLNPEHPWNIKLSSAGLVYHHFGKCVLKSIIGCVHPPELIQSLYQYMYLNFVQEIDAIDNGVSMFDGEPKYRINTNLSSRVGYLNQTWNDPEPYDPMCMFNKAMTMVGTEFEGRVKYFIQAWWPARKLVQQAVTNRFNIHESGEIMQLDTCCPWKEHLENIEKDDQLEVPIKFVLFSDTSKNWRVQAVPMRPTSFVVRLPLHDRWQGLRDDELSRVSGIANCIFVHSTGFIGGNKTRDGALAMAVKSLQPLEEHTQGNNNPDPPPKQEPGTPANGNNPTPANSEPEPPIQKETVMSLLMG